MKKLIAFLILITIFAGCGSSSNNEPVLSNDIFKLEFNNLMHSKIISNLENTNPLMQNFYPSENLILSKDTLKDFNLSKTKRSEDSDKTTLILEGVAEKEGLKIQKEVNVSILKDFSDFIITTVKYTNLGNDTLEVVGWINNSYEMLPYQKSPAYWSYQSGSYANRRDWVQPINVGFDQGNYLGMNASDYGGGTPVSDIWRPDVGLAVGHLETVPKLVFLPVKYDSSSQGANLKVLYNYLTPVKLAPGKSVETFETFVSIHKGDYYHTLSQFSDIMKKKGLTYKEFPKTTYNPIWCAWGYERNFTINEVIGTLPKVEEIGYNWAVLDDGWQTAEGDWYLNTKRFPNGDSDMKAFVKRINDRGLKAKLWWAPLAVDPGTDLIKHHPEYLLLNKDSSKQDITWWDSYYLCPAYKPVIDYHVNLVQKIMKDWSYDGLKIDGQHLNGAPPCYNPAHHHERPEESVEQLPAFFKAIYDAALEINPNAVVEICPCGTAYSFYNLHYMNQTVSSDPTSSWQVRLKGKTLKALMGPNSPYYGDHVELSDGGTDFASTVGVGGIIGTKFTWPTDRLEHKKHVLTKSKEEAWKKWFNIYKENMLPEANYRGELYDIGYDKPETHVVQKGDTLYYAFYSPKWDGNIELRGLDKNKEYEIINYVDNRKIAEVQNESPELKNTKIKNYLLIKAVPK